MDTVRFYVDANGKALGYFNYAPDVDGAKVVPAPSDARQVWDGQSWGPSDEAQRDAFKIERQKLVDAITVDVSGMTFDGDEISQGRMARAIIGLQSQPEGTTVQWVLHDNTVVDVGLAVLQEALTLAGLRQTELWTQT
jgi:hypothetical protein